MNTILRTFPGSGVPERLQTSGQKEGEGGRPSSVRVVKYAALHQSMLS